MFVLDEKIKMVTTDYGVVMMNMKKGDYWELNDSGAVVLKVLVDGGDLAGATQRLMEEYDIGQEVAARDAAEILAELVAAGIVRETTEDRP